MFQHDRDTFNILFEAVSEGIIVVDVNQHIVAINPAASQMFGYSRDELTDMPLNKLIPVNFHPKHQVYFEKFLLEKKSRKMGQGSTQYGVTKFNIKFPVEIGLNPFEINERTFVMAVVIDITARKAAEEEIENLNRELEKRIRERTAQLNDTIAELKELNQNYKLEIQKKLEAENKMKETLRKEIELNELKTKFLSLVSHEFKTPLSGILTSVMLLEKYQLTEQQEKRDKHLKTITNKVHYLNNILNDFLSIERIDSGKLNYKFTTFNLSKIINEVVYNANMLLKSGQRIHIPQSVDEYILYQDEKILELALSNLIHNAIKYSPENTAIEIGVKQKGSHMIFTVKDKGIGIPEKDQKHIFNRYFRAENAINSQGTGIGLNIVKNHLENLGGSITFKSAENVGSVFKIELPLDMNK